MEKTFCGYISIVGKPNVGKSTILNHILGKKVSITSRKSQTTRNNILGIKTVNNKQMIFADTPGMHIKSTKVMNRLLNKSAASLIEDSDLILFVIQRASMQELDNLVLEKIKESESKVICVINKSDQVDDKNKLLPLLSISNSLSLSVVLRESNCNSALSASESLLKFIIKSLVISV